jgi:hypothetical protein
MLQHLNHNTNLELDKVVIPLQEEGVNMKQFKMFYSLHRNTLFQSIWDLHHKISLLLFTSETLINICTHATILYNGTYQKLSFIAGHLDNDLFEAGDICLTAKRRKSCCSVLVLENSLSSGASSNNNDAATVDNRISPHARHVTQFFPKQKTDGGGDDVNDFFRNQSFYSQFSFETCIVHDI